MSTNVVWIYVEQGKLFQSEDCFEDCSSFSTSPESLAPLIQENSKTFVAENLSLFPSALQNVAKAFK